MPLADCQEISGSWRRPGFRSIQATQLPYHPATLLSLLIYGYATGCHISRKIERATYDSLAFRFIAARPAKAAASGRKPGGKPPKAPTLGPCPEEQINLTDEESRIMPVAGGGFEQSYNAQALVDTETMLALVPHVTQAVNDKQRITPVLERIEALPEVLATPQQRLADAGYFSEANVGACEEAGFEPSLAIQRDEHHPHWSERSTDPEYLGFARIEVAANRADAALPLYERSFHILATLVDRATRDSPVG